MPTSTGPHHLLSTPPPLSAAVSKFLAALDAHKHWPTDELALLLVGAEARPGVHLADHKSPGLGCLRPALSSGQLSRDAVAQVGVSEGWLGELVG